MINGNVLICPECQTEEHLYATPGRHHIRIECDKEEGGCGRQFVIPNDGGVKLSDNILQQQLDSVPDKFFAGFIGYHGKGVGETLTWTLVGIVSELKKKELEDHLKLKVEALSKLEITQEVKYELREYGVGIVRAASSIASPCNCNDNNEYLKQPQTFEEMADKHAMSKEEVKACIEENERLLQDPMSFQKSYMESDLTADQLRFNIRDGLNMEDEGIDPKRFDLLVDTVDPNDVHAGNIGSHLEAVDKVLRQLKIPCELMECIFSGERGDINYSNKVIIRFLTDEGWTYDPELGKEDGWGDTSFDESNAFIEAGVFKIKGSLSKQTVSSTIASVKEHVAKVELLKATLKTSEEDERGLADLITKHGKIKEVKCGCCGSSEISAYLNDEDRAEDKSVSLTSKELIDSFEETKKNGEPHEFSVIDCDECEGQTDNLTVIFEDDHKEDITWDEYPKLFGVRKIKTYMDDFLGVLSDAVKKGTKIIGI